MFAGADDGDTSFYGVLLRKLRLVFLSRQVMMAINVVSFVKALPRRSRTALLDAGPRGTFVTYV